VESLGEKKRTVFVLHDLEGLSPVEIGEIVDAPVLTVRTRLFYARRELEALMAADPELAGVAGSFSTATAESDTKTAGHDKLVEVSPVTSSEGRGS
jgi:RNA polymerase sigma-70 factor (ECF subfamily)